MKVIHTNNSIFDIPTGVNHAVCVTTNGMIKKDGTAIMGKGIALEANKLFHISDKLGTYLKEYGNRCFDMGVHTYKSTSYHVITFPTKHDWKSNSDINLIKESCYNLIKICNGRNIEKCFLPPVGCTNGNLNFGKDVEPILKEILDDRFIVVLKE